MIGSGTGRVAGLARGNERNRVLDIETSVTRHDGFHHLFPACRGDDPFDPLPWKRVRARRKRIHGLRARQGEENESSSARIAVQDIDPHRFLHGTSPDQAISGADEVAVTKTHPSLSSQNEKPRARTVRHHGHVFVGSCPRNRDERRDDEEGEAGETRKTPHP
jgi:hypothetical protein